MTPRRSLRATDGLGFARKVGLVAALGALLRLLLLARQPLGYDEDFTAAVLARPFDRMLDAVAHDSAPPLFYVLEWPIAQILPGTAGLRLVPVLAGIALIPLLAALARRAAGDAAGLWAAAFVAVAPATVLSAENARMYSLAGALVVAATLLLWRAAGPAADPAARRRVSGTWALFGLAAAGAVWTDYFAAPALAGLLAALAWLRPPRRVLLTAGAVSVAAVATIGFWFLAAPAQLGHAGQGFWIPPLSPTSVAGTFGQLFAGPPVDGAVAGREILVALQIGAVAAASIGLLAAGVAWRGAPAQTRRSALFLVICCGGVLALAAVSVFRPILEARYAFVMWLPLFALAGFGLAAMPRPFSAGLLAATLVASVAIGGIATTHPETETLIPRIEAQLGPNDLVAADGNHYLVLLSEGSPGLTARLHLLAAQDPPWYFGTAAYPDGAVIHAVPAELARSGGTIFWVADPGSEPPSLPAGYVPLSRDCGLGVCVTSYGAG